MTDFTKFAMSDNRERRANQFTNQIIGMLRDYLPPGREVRRMICDELWKIAHDGNLEIISVPPEFDALTKLELERRMVETHPGFIHASASGGLTLPGDQTPTPPPTPEAPQQ